MKQEKKDVSKKLAQQATGTSPVAETHPTERVAARDPLARIAKYLDHDALVALADHLEEMNPAYPGAFDLQFMQPLVAPGNVIAPFNERVTGLAAEESLGNYVHYGRQYADVASAAIRALFPGLYDKVDAADQGLEIATESLSSLVLGVALERALGCREDMGDHFLRRASKIAKSATYFNGTAEECAAANKKFDRKLQKLSALIAEMLVLDKSQEG